jgi:hypothetical protein
MSALLEGWALEFLATPRRYATLATLDPSGAPLQAVVWYALRDGGILVNSRQGRRWPTNLLRDPQVSFLVHDGLDYVAVRGLAERLYQDQADELDRAMADITALARAYHVSPGRIARAIEELRGQRRISFLLRPVSVTVHREA